MANFKNNYDLEERTAQFVRSATSIGANYMEANGASSPKDFANKIFICKKEAQETKHWLRMLVSCFPEKKEQINVSWNEAQEFTLIFNKICSTMKIKNSVKIEK